MKALILLIFKPVRAIAKTPNAESRKKAAPKRKAPGQGVNLLWSHLKVRRLMRLPKLLHEKKTGSGKQQSLDLENQSGYRLPSNDFLRRPIKLFQVLPLMCLMRIQECSINPW